MKMRFPGGFSVVAPLCASVLSALLPGATLGQVGSADGPHPVIAALEGQWEGTGTLLEGC